MAIDCVQTALDVLESIHCDVFHGEESSVLGELKELLRFLRTCYMCVRIWGKPESTLVSIEDTVLKHSLEIQSLCLASDDDQVAADLRSGVSDFLVCIKERFLPEMVEMYRKLSHGSSGSHQVEVLISIMDSLLQNQQDVSQFCMLQGICYPSFVEIEKLVRFLKSFVVFATFKGLQCSQMEDLLIHVEGFVVKIADIPFKLRYYPTIDRLDGFTLAYKNKASQPHIALIYVGALKSSRSCLELCLSSDHTRSQSHRLMLLDFLDHFLDIESEELFNDTDFMQNIIHQTQRFSDDLFFLRSLLMVHEKYFDELYENMYDLIGDAIWDAATIMCSLFAEENEGLELLFSNLTERLNFIREEEARRNPLLMSTSYFPQTSVPGFIDCILEKMRSIDSKAFAEDKVQAIQADLVFLGSFFVDVMLEFQQHKKLHVFASSVAAVVSETKLILNTFVAGCDLQSLVLQLKTIAEDIILIAVEASKTYRSMKIKANNVSTTCGVLPLTSDIQALNEFVMGFDDEAQEIISRITGGTEQLEIVSIVGIPGLGKTTLAKKVFSDNSIISLFQSYSWCSVSQAYDVKSMFLEILYGALGFPRGDDYTSNEDILGKEVFRILEGKKYLIVLDDVRDIATWNRLRSSFPDEGNGSRILLTSRHHNVALQIKPDSEPHSLRFLTNDESQELLMKRMCYEKFNSLTLLEETMAQCCKGVPLMITLSAGILLNTKQDSWEEISKSMMDREDMLSITEKCVKVLELSYSFLPNHLKSCFLYFGAFEGMKRISVRELLWLWIAEGFVGRTKGKSLEDVAYGYLMELIKRGLVMAVKKGSSEKAKICVLNDLVFDFCKAKCIEEPFVKFLQGDEVSTSTEPSISCRLSLCCQRGVFAASSSRLLSPCLRSLFFSADDEAVYKGQWYDIWYKICQSKLLRVLDLRNVYTCPLFPSAIALLAHLRYLALTLSKDWPWQITIPSSIQDLSNLETFLIRGSERHHCVILPNTVWNMNSLRHLCFSGMFSYWKFPEENLEFNSNLDNLQTLSAVEFSSEQAMMEVTRKFPNIRRLKCKYYTEKGDFLALDFMSKLESLSLYAQSRGFSRVQLDGYRFHQNLKRLVLIGVRLPWSEISAIDKLPNLEVLKLRGSFVGEIWDTEEGAFPKLMYLKLSFLDLAKWTAPDNSFPCLQKLFLEECTRLEEVPSCLAYLSTLRKIDISDCGSVANSVKLIQKGQISIGNKNLRIFTRQRI